jgi:hypothetical protein
MPRNPSVPSVSSEESAPRGDSFTDLREACHRWLMKKDPTYAKHQARVARLGEHRPNRRVKLTELV